MQGAAPTHSVCTRFKLRWFYYFFSKYSMVSSHKFPDKPFKRSTRQNRFHLSIFALIIIPISHWSLIRGSSADVVSVYGMSVLCSIRYTCIGDFCPHDAQHPSKRAILYVLKCIGGRSEKLYAHLNLELRSRICGILLTHTLYVFMTLRSLKWLCMWNFKSWYGLTSTVD